jgi:hypothetical protein
MFQKDAQITISYNETLNGNSPLVKKFLQNEFDLLPYKNFQVSMKKLKGFDFGYIIKSGKNDNRTFHNFPTYVHAVFQEYDPHGTYYAYVSEWLAKKMQRTHFLSHKRILSSYRGVCNSFNFDFVPHIVDLPQSNANVRELYSIPEYARLGIRYGGADSFDIPWVKTVVSELLEDPKNYFLFMNTNQFIQHPRCLFIPPAIEKIHKSNFLQAGDYFLHARKRGESFGLSILEAMATGTPVLSWKGGVDRNHTKLLAPDSLYRGPKDLMLKIRNIENYTNRDAHFQKSKEFSPEIVKKRFLNIFKP